MLDKYRNQLVNDGKIYLKVKLVPGAIRTEIRAEMLGGTVKIAVAAPASRGKANLALSLFLARELAVDRKNVKIISGLSSRNKLIKIIK